MFRFTDKFITTLRLSIIAGGILGVSVLHYFTPLSEPVLHDIYQRLYYLPIILAAFWFGMKGGIGTAIIVSFLYLASHSLSMGRLCGTFGPQRNGGR